MWGDDYYTSNNTAIMCRRKEFYHPDRGLMCDPYKANHKLPSGFFKKIVDQKVQYLLGNGLESEHKDSLNRLTGDIDKHLIDIGTIASKKSMAWAYLYKDNGQDKVTIIPNEQVVSFWDGDVIQLIVRFYKTTEVIDNEIEHINKAELWDKDTVKIFVKIDKEYKFQNEMCHYYDTVEFNGAKEQQDGHAWGFVPFIPLFNNKEALSDLKPIKPQIDIYDITKSDFANNIDDMQDAYYILKNYSGQDPGEFLEQLKAHKAVPVGEGGDVEPKQLEIPTEARKVFLDSITRDIYEFSMSVDMKSVSGGQLTNVAIASMYADLDLKADQFESEIQAYLLKLLEITSPNAEADFAFDRSLVFNVEDRINSLKDLGVQISNKTKLGMFPLIDDVDEEEKRIKEEIEQNATDIDNDMGFGDE